MLLGPLAPEPLFHFSQSLFDDEKIDIEPVNGGLKYGDNCHQRLEDIDALIPNSGEVILDDELVAAVFLDKARKHTTASNPTSWSSNRPSTPRVGAIPSFETECWDRADIQNSWTSLTVLKCVDGKTAKELLKARAMWLTPSEDGVLKFKTSRDVDSNGERQLWAVPALDDVADVKIWGGSFLNMFIYGNLLVEIESLYGIESGVKIAVEMIQYLKGLPER